MIRVKKFSVLIFLGSFIVACASRGPTLAAREELYEKVLQPGTIEKVAKVKEAAPVNQSSPQEKIPDIEVSFQEVDEEAWLSEGLNKNENPVKKMQSLSFKEDKSFRNISSHQDAEALKKTQPKTPKSFSKVVIDDLDLEVVPSTSSSSGKGFLLND